MKQATSFKAWLIWTLRRASYRWPARGQAMAEARVSRGQYRCAKCKGIFGNKHISLDHKKPVVNPKWPKKWDWKVYIAEYIERLFCDKEGFQVLCDDCHDEKTAREKAIRAAA
jgi:hypothetical protein